MKCFICQSDSPFDCLSNFFIIGFIPGIVKTLISPIPMGCRRRTSAPQRRASSKCKKHQPIPQTLENLHLNWASHQREIDRKPVQVDRNRLLLVFSVWRPQLLHPAGYSGRALAFGCLEVQKERTYRASGSIVLSSSHSISLYSFNVYIVLLRLPIFSIWSVSIRRCSSHHPAVEIPNFLILFGNQRNFTLSSQPPLER